MEVMVGLIVQANSLSVSLGQKYRMMKATMRKGMIKAASQRVSGRMRSSCIKPDEFKKARLLLISFMSNLLFIGKPSPIYHCYPGLFEIHHCSSFRRTALCFAWERKRDCELP